MYLTASIICCGRNLHWNHVVYTISYERRRSLHTGAKLKPNLHCCYSIVILVITCSRSPAGQWFVPRLIYCNNTTLVRLHIQQHLSRLLRTESLIAWQFWSAVKGGSTTSGVFHNVQCGVCQFAAHKIRYMYNSPPRARTHTHTHTHTHMHTHMHTHYAQVYCWPFLISRRETSKRAVKELLYPMK